MNNSQLKVYYKKNTSKSPLIIFIHGAACDHTLWLYQTRYFFNKNFSVISMDLPGHGKNLTKPLNSIKGLSDLIKKLIKSLPNKEIYLVGHSMGSLICLETSLANFREIKKIFLIGTSYPMQVNKSLLLKSKTDQDSAIKDMINWSLSDRIKLNGANLIGLNLPNLINVIMSNSRKGLLYKNLLACNNFILNKNKIEEVKTPFTIIAGSNDIMTSKKNSEILNDMLFDNYKIGSSINDERQYEFERIVYKAGSHFIVGLFISSFVQFVLASIIVTANPGEPLFSEQVATMTWVSFLAVFVITLSIVGKGYLGLISGIEKITGLKREDFLKT